MSESVSTVTVPPTDPSISLSQIATLVASIDHAAEQGAFKGWAIIDQVRTARDAVAAFLKAQQDIIAANTPPEASPDAPVAPAPASE